MLVKTTNPSCNEPKQPLLDDDIAICHEQFDKERNLSHLPIFTSLSLKRKRHISYMDFEKLTLDGFIDAGALTSAISEQDLNKIKILANEYNTKWDDPLGFFNIHSVAKHQKN